MRIPSTLTTQEEVRAWTQQIMDIEFTLNQHRPDLKGGELAGTGCIITEENAHLLQKPASKEPSNHHRWKAQGSLRCRSNSQWPRHSARCTNRNWKLHRVGGGRLYLGALHYWVPDKQLHVRVSISTLLKDTVSSALKKTQTSL